MPLPGKARKFFTPVSPSGVALHRPDTLMYN